MVRELPRHRRNTRVALAVLGLFVLGAGASATGFGASSATVTPSASVVGTLTLSDPTTLNAAPPVCTDAIAPLDTDDCTDVRYTASPAKALSLGSLSGADVQAASLTWTVTTTNPSGYQVVMSNGGGAPLMSGPAGTIPDMQSSPMVPASAVDDATQFGVAIGNPTSDNETSVTYAGSPWVTSSGQQGELFRGIPTAAAGGVQVAGRLGPQVDDPFTATFAAASIPSAQPAAGAYSGTISVTASAA